MMEIQIHNRQEICKIDRRKIILLVKETLGKFLSCQGEINVIIVDNRKIRELNKKYLHRSAATDVIAFSYNTRSKKEDFYGDVFISAEQAEKQAKDYRNTLKSEMHFLVIHGILHLLGWEDDTTEQRKKMLKKQEEILKRFSLNKL
ncbi:MAG: rRNA maturation RNase YbeY [Elusimicrobiota bacterium]